jgi:hypothetical protein
MSTQILITKSGEFEVIEYSAGSGVVHLQITDLVYTYMFMETGYIKGISKDEAKEIGEALIKWASI